MPTEPKAPAPSAGPSAAVPRRRRSIVPMIVAAVLLAPIILMALYTQFVLKWAYSDGDRSGYLQKFSRKGWVCKTYEGELAMTSVPGVAPTIWTFSVPDRTVATKLNAALGRKVVLHYTEHRGVPTQCFATTNYYVDSVRVLE
ncbi:MAG: hypothetical protein ABI637_03930 [Gemmatimonadota bacterium]